MQADEAPDHRQAEAGPLVGAVVCARLEEWVADRGRSAAAMPMPVSVTMSRTRWLSRRTDTVT